jgi:hypothetical protein
MNESNQSIIVSVANYCSTLPGTIADLATTSTPTSRVKYKKYEATNSNIIFRRLIRFIPNLNRIIQVPIITACTQFKYKYKLVSTGFESDK